MQDVSINHDLISSSSPVIVKPVVTLALADTERIPFVTKVEIHRLHSDCSRLLLRGQRLELLLMRLHDIRTTHGFKEKQSKDNSETRARPALGVGQIT